MTTPHDKKDRHSQTKRAADKAGAARPAEPGQAPDIGSDVPSATGDASQTDDDATPVAAAASLFSIGGGVAAEPEPSPQALTDALLAVSRERDQYLDHLQRLKAEFENYRKRVQRDNAAVVARAGERVIESLLPVVDNLQRALEAATRHEEGQVIEGIEVVTGQLRSVLAGHGLEEVPAAAGLPFDPNVHEAVVAQEHDDYPEGAIIAVLEPGYLLHGRLLRPSRVIVAR
jgi:molecular chaperone GrpE (heat shock protein)